MGKAFTALKALPARTIPVLREDQAARVGLEVQVVPGALAARVVPGAQVVRVALGGPGAQVVRVDPVVQAGQVVPGGPEEDRVDPAGKSDPAVGTGILLRRRLQANHCHRNF